MADIEDLMRQNENAAAQNYRAIVRNEQVAQQAGESYRKLAERNQELAEDAGRVFRGEK